MHQNSVGRCFILCLASSEHRLQILGTEIGYLTCRWGKGSAVFRFSCLLGYSKGGKDPGRPCPPNTRETGIFALPACQPQIWNREMIVSTLGLLVN